MTEQQPDGGDAVIAQLFRQDARLERVDNREDAHYQDLARRLTELARTLSGVNGTIKDQGDILRPLAGIDKRIDELEAVVRPLLPREKPPSEDYEPRPTIRWWQLQDEEHAAEREEAVTRLRYWARRIFVPGYGYLAAMLPKCWAQHELCLYALDWLCETWSVMYITEERTMSTLAAQAEFQTRILPAACDQLRREGEKCEHEKDNERASLSPA